MAPKELLQFGLGPGAAAMVGGLCNKDEERLLVHVARHAFWSIWKTWVVDRAGEIKCPCHAKKASLYESVSTLVKFAFAMAKIPLSENELMDILKLRCRPDEVGSTLVSAEACTDLMADNRERAAMQEHINEVKSAMEHTIIEKGFVRFYCTCIVPGKITV